VFIDKPEFRRLQFFSWISIGCRLGPDLKDAWHIIFLPIYQKRFLRQIGFEYQVKLQWKCALHAPFFEAFWQDERNRVAKLTRFLDEFDRERRLATKRWIPYHMRLSFPGGFMYILQVISGCNLGAAWINVVKLAIVGQ
jgi:hypothetical protein